MKRDYLTQHSTSLGEDLDLVVYGETGRPVVAFAPAANACTALEDNGMVDVLSSDIESGKIQLFCVSNVDSRSWLARAATNEHRAELQEAYYRYVTEEVVPFVHERNASELRPFALGVDLGATHAAIVALRRPDLFQGCLCLSGSYDSGFYFDGWMDGTLYESSPAAFLSNMPADHDYVAAYNRRSLCFCTGQGAYEEECQRTQGILKAAFDRLGVNVWCDVWGDDVSHDWYWWNKQVAYFMPFVYEDIEKMAAEDAEAAAAAAPAKKVPAKRKPAAKKATTAKKTTATKRTTTRKAAAKTAAAEEKPATTAKRAAATKKATAAKAAPKATEAKVAEPAAKKAEEKPAAAAKPAVKKAPATKAAATKAATTKAAATKAATTKASEEKPAAAKPAAKKAAAPKAAETKATAAAKPAAEKPAEAKPTAAKAEPATKKATTAKTAAKKPVTVKAAAKKRSSK